MGAPIDIERAVRGLRRLDRRHRRASRRSSRSSTPETLDLVPRFEELRDAGAADDVLAESIAGELISSEIEIRSGRGEDLHRRDPRPARAPARGCSRSPPRAASRSARPARTRGPTTASSPTSTPSTTAASSTACSTSRGATTPSRCTSTSACATSTARRASATACGPCCRCCWRSAPNSPFLDGRDSGLHSARTQIVHQELPALRHPRRLRLLARLPRLRRLPVRTELDRRVHAGLVVGAPALLRSAPSRCASATRRRPPARPRRWRR